MNDEALLQRALDLAAGALNLSNPNPRVGCVLVRDGQVIGEGHTQRAGEAHAEVMALRDAQARGVVGVTDLEFGRPWEQWQAREDAGMPLLRARVGVYPDGLAKVVLFNPRVPLVGRKVKFDQIKTFCFFYNEFFGNLGFYRVNASSQHPDE